MHHASRLARFFLRPASRRGRRAIQTPTLDALESRVVLSDASGVAAFAAPPLVAAIDAASDLDGNGVVVRPTVRLTGQTTPNTRVRLDVGADGTFQRATRSDAEGRFVLRASLAAGENRLRVVAGARGGETSEKVVEVLRGDAVLNWNATLLRLTREQRLNPVVTSRNLAILHTSIYDAVNSIRGGFEAYAAELDAPRGASLEAAAAAAGHRAMSRLFSNPAQAGLLEASFREGLSSAGRGVGRRMDGAEVGIAAADTIAALRVDDGSAAPSTYTPTPGPGRWRPTPTRPGTASPAALAPQWGSQRTWAMISNDQFRCPPPPALDSDAYAAAVNEVKAIGAVDSTVRTADQADIARFWSDDAGTSTPPGHWNRIAASLASARGGSLAENARLFALLNITNADAAICCWETKFTYDLWRPYTAIREAATDGNPATEADPNWSPLIFLPPFPTYSSGHSTFSGGSSVLLATYFGRDEIAFTDSSEGVGVADRSFESFTQAAAEAADSRLFGGIHFAFDNQAGLDAGTDLGRYVFANFLRPQA